GRDRFKFSDCQIFRSECIVSDGRLLSGLALLSFSPIWTSPTQSGLGGGPRAQLHQEVRNTSVSKSQLKSYCHSGGGQAARCKPIRLIRLAPHTRFESGSPLKALQAK